MAAVERLPHRPHPEQLDPVGEAEFRDARLCLLEFGAAAGHRHRRRPPVRRLHLDQRLDQIADALGAAELADIDEIVRVRIAGQGVEFLRREAVVDHLFGAGRPADHLVEAPLREGAFEDVGVGDGADGVLDRAEEAADQRARLVVEHAAMRGVERHPVAASEARQPGMYAALGAVPVQHVDLERVGQPPHPERRGDVAHPHGPRHREIIGAERDRRGELTQPLPGQCVRGQAVGDHAHLVAAPRQLLGEVVDVPEQPAHRRAQDLHDTERRRGQFVRASVRR